MRWPNAAVRRRAPLSVARVAAIVFGWVFLAVCPTPSWAAPFDAVGQDWEGYADFIKILRREIGTRRVVVTSRLDWGALRSSDALLIVFPDHGVDTISTGAFVRAGGRVALLDDYGAGDDLLGSFGIRRVPLPREPREALRDNPDFAIAEPSDTSQPLMHGVERIVTNHATGLFDPRVTNVLTVRAKSGADVPLAVALSSGDGRMAAIGDPSIFMNSMLRYPGNRELAKNLASYLTQGPGESRVFVVIKNFAEVGSFGGERTPEHALLATLQRLRGSVAREGLPTWVVYWLSFVATTFIVLWLVPRTVRTFRAAPPRFTRTTPTEKHGGAAGRAAALGAKQAYRGHAVLEWRRALVEDLTAFFGLSRDASNVELLRQLGGLGVVDAKAIRALERLLLRMAEIDTMIAARQTHALEPIRDEEVLAAGKLVTEVLARVHAQHGLPA